MNNLDFSECSFQILWNSFHFSTRFTVFSFAVQILHEVPNEALWPFWPLEEISVPDEKCIFAQILQNKEQEDIKNLSLYPFTTSVPVTSINASETDIFKTLSHIYDGYFCKNS